MEHTANYNLVSKLTDDLLIEILSRLPIKSLLQCKCVSKAWNSLISDSKKLPQFISGLFYHVHGLKPGNWNYEVEYVSMLQSQNDDNSMDKSLSFLPCSQYRIVDCCNGLLLCHSVEGTLHTCYVCNPATKRWTELPMPDYHLILLALCFNPSISLNYTVIGLKVESSGDMTNKAPVLFSSKNPKWVEKNVPRRCEMNSYIRQQVLLNGSIHYLAYTKPFAWGIDLEREIYRKIKLPVSKREVNYWNACLGQSQGYLHYAQKFDDRMVVWVLLDYDETKWGLKNTIHFKILAEKQEVSVAPLSSNNLPSMAYLDLLVFHPDFDALFIRIDGKIFSYHLVSSKLTEIVIPLKKTGRFYPYRPCLVEDSL